MFRPFRRLQIPILVCLLAGASGCVLAPAELETETARAVDAGTPFEPPAAERSLPELPPQPTWQDVVRRALLANGELEAAYFEWRAALERIGIAAAYPNTNVSIGFEYLFSPGNVKAWDRTTISAAFDPMQNLSFPTKVTAAGRVAFDDARAAGERFFAMKLEIQNRVLSAYLDYALAAEKLRIHHGHAHLLGIAADSARARVGGGAAQQQILGADVAHRLAEDEVLVMEAELPRLRATLNAMMGRDAGAPLPDPATLPEPRTVASDDALLALAVTRNPELAALAQEARGRSDAVDLARQQYFPDINPFAGFTGSIEQMVGAAITLPTTIPQIRAAIREARAMQRASDARLRQATHDRAGELVAALVVLRDSERRIALFDEQIQPLARLAVESTSGAYSAGAVGLDEVLGAESTLLDVQLALAEARIERERRIAEIEKLTGVDPGSATTPLPEPLSLGGRSSPLSPPDPLSQGGHSSPPSPPNPLSQGGRGGEGGGV